MHLLEKGVEQPGAGPQVQVEAFVPGVNAGEERLLRQGCWRGQQVCETWASVVFPFKHASGEDRLDSQSTQVRTVRLVHRAAVEGSPPAVSRS